MLIFQDTGCDTVETNRPHIDDAFLARKVSERVLGLGGLAVTYSLVERMNGENKGGQ